MYGTYRSPTTALPPSDSLGPERPSQHSGTGEVLDLRPQSAHRLFTPIGSAPLAGIEPATHG